MRDFVAVLPEAACAEPLAHYYPGAPVYVIHQGDKGLPVFFDDDDYHFYLELLQQGLRRQQGRLHAYLLLDDAVHLLLTPPNEFSLLQKLEHIASIYQLYLNRKYHCEGMGFSGKFKVCTVNPQEYLLKCSRYIESYVLSEEQDVIPEQYPWSSYHYNARGRNDELLQPHSRYLLLGRNRVERYMNYRDMFDSLLSSRDVFAIKRAINSGAAMANEQPKHSLAVMPKRVRG